MLRAFLIAVLAGVGALLLLSSPAKADGPTRDDCAGDVDGDGDTDLTDLGYWQGYWERALERSVPWMIVEEHETYFLADALDSAWSNYDSLTDRHMGQACVAHVDGSVSARSYWRVSMDVRIGNDSRHLRKFEAWKAYYELTDGRIVSAGHPGKKFGFLRTASAVND